MKVEIIFNKCTDCPYWTQSGLYGWDCEHPNADNYEDEDENEKDVKFPNYCPWLKEGTKLEISPD